MTSEATPPPAILVVDDDPAIVRMLSDALKRKFRVTTAEDGERAWELVMEQAFTAILADHMMPGLTGVELLGRVAKSHPDTIRILATASDNLNDIRSAVNEARVHRYLQKPLRPVELAGIVAGAIRESEMEAENRRLVVKLQHKNEMLSVALAKVQEHERVLEQQVASRTKELRELVAQLEELALRDGLTGMYNHRYFQEALTTELARAARHQFQSSLIFLDVDHFKNFNDLNGHPAGDELLRMLAMLITDTGEFLELTF